MATLAVILAAFALSSSVYLWLELQKKPSATDITRIVSSYSDELKVTYGRSVKEIETEWADMYSKFTRLAGRMDKERALASPPGQEKEPVRSAFPGTRSDLVRKHRAGAV